MSQPVWINSVGEVLVFVGGVGGGLHFVGSEALDHVDQLLLFFSGGK